MFLKSMNCFGGLGSCCSEPLSADCLDRLSCLHQESGGRVNESVVAANEAVSHAPEPLKLRSYPYTAPSAFIPAGERAL
jgi:hypothetical protein